MAVEGETVSDRLGMTAAGELYLDSYVGRDEQSRDAPVGLLRASAYGLSGG